MKVERFLTGIISTNCYLAINEETKQTVVIDPASSSPSLMNHIEAEGLKVEAILLTHGHFDHIMAAEKLRQEFAVKLYCSEAEREICMDTELNMGRAFGFLSSVVPDETFKDGQELIFGSLSCKVIATPGHTRGGRVLLL